MQWPSYIFSLSIVKEKGSGHSLSRLSIVDWSLDALLVKKFQKFILAWEIQNFKIGRNVSITFDQQLIFNFLFFVITRW